VRRLTSDLTVELLPGFGIGFTVESIPQHRRDSWRVQAQLVVACVAVTWTVMWLPRWRPVIVARVGGPPRYVDAAVRPRPGQQRRTPDGTPNRGPGPH
jgi:hypothetical protein